MGALPKLGSSGGGCRTAVSKNSIQLARPQDVSCFTPAPMSGLIDPLRPAWWAARRRALALRHALRTRLPADPARIATTPKTFILSTGRTGTMFLAHFCDAHSARVRACHEPYPPLLELGLEAAAGRVSVPAAAARLARARRWSLGRLDRPAYLEANNRLFALIPALQLAYPGATIIHIVRDGRAFVRSGLRRDYYGPTDRFPRLAAPDLPVDPWAAAWAGWDPLRKCAWLWAAQNRIMRADGAALPTYHLFRFEAVFGSPAGLRALLHVIDPALALSDEVLSAALARKVNAGPADAPEAPWTAVQEAAFWEIAGPEMAHYGYER